MRFGITNEKSANIAKKILKAIDLDETSEDYKLNINRLVGFTKNDLLPSIKHELKGGDPLSEETLNEALKFHKFDAVLLVGFKPIKGKQNITYMPFGKNPNYTNMANNVGKVLNEVLNRMSIETEIRKN